MLQTRTGNFPIGFRRGGSEWLQNLDQVLAWAKESELGVIDIGPDADTTAAQVVAAGLSVGSADALNWPGWMSPNAETRAASVQANIDYIQTAAKAGAKNFFAVLLPENPELPRSENFGYAVESLSALVPTLEAYDAHIVLEGWPGPGALCCTPETYRALLTAIPSKAIGINYDPSHLLRMGIDPIRFLKEFVDRVFHVHGKDTEIVADNVYEFGTEQPATFAEAPAFGGYAWRYTIPGQGLTNWSLVFRILVENNYQGAVSIELEDADYNGTESGEKLGLLTGARFLATC
jgi:sugar phosphate isomerase/epimerase